MIHRLKRAFGATDSDDDEEESGGLLSRFLG